jgi:hypothetical protein
MTDAQADPKKVVDDVLAQANQVLAENAPER